MKAKKQPLEQTLVDREQGLVPPRTTGGSTPVVPPPMRIMPTQRFLALGRSSVPRLCVLDDLSDSTGEWFWLRERVTAIGRIEGSIRIGNDPDISGRHATIERSSTDDGEDWKLVDQSSTNGTFVRITRFGLEGDHELRLGSRLYQWTQNVDAGETVGQLHEIDCPERSWLFDASRTYVVGRSNNANHRLGDDPCLDDCHASWAYSRSKSWVVQDLQSLNGLWLRVSQWPLVDGTQFMLGGQRFRFSIDPIGTAQT